MHTATGDLYAVAPEPRRERAPRRQHVQLIPCRLYNSEHPVSKCILLWCTKQIKVRNYLNVVLLLWMLNF